MRTPEEIGRIVREMRGSMSLRDFAEKCSMSHTTIDNIEKGFDRRTGKVVQIKIATLDKIANACNVPLSYVIGDCEENSITVEQQMVVRSITKDELTLISMYRKVDMNVKELIKLLLEHEVGRKTKTNGIVLSSVAARSNDNSEIVHIEFIPELEDVPEDDVDL